MGEVVWGVNDSGGQPIRQRPNMSAAGPLFALCRISRFSNAE